MLKAALPFAVAVLAAGVALAQEAPSPREACKPDIQKLCPDLQAGQRPGECLRQHKDELSDACKAAIARRHADHQGAKGGAPNPN